MVLVGDVCSELFELGKTPNHPEQPFHDALQTLRVQHQTCVLQLLLDANQTPQPILPFSDAKISGFERLRVPGCSVDLSRAHVKSRAG